MNEIVQENTKDDGFNLFLHEFMQETDRASVVLGAAKLDLLLFQILQKHFIANATIDDELLDSSKPLGSFSAKIQIAHRLGLIDNSFAKVLHQFRKIRNAFAHEIAGCKLDSGSHCDRVIEIVSPYKNDLWFKKLCDSTTMKYKVTGRSLEFRVLLGMMIIDLQDLFMETVPLTQQKAMTVLHHSKEMQKA